MEDNKSSFNRRNFLLGSGSAVLLMATSAPVYSKAPGILKGAGIYRQLQMYNGQTNENIKIIYWIEGKYIPDALVEISKFMRDWRENKWKQIDKRTINILSAVHKILDTNEPIQLLSGYRTVATNEMLRKRSRAVSKNSYHTLGMAADIRIRGVSTRQLANAGDMCRSGGVGKYSRSNFVHLDCAKIRSWGS
ncbi:MAG: DUF882 domain-containing protein [Rhodobacteraceae bacterium]|nr:DUF882 domain-containing protein [Paracoccaceae bacterium]MCY4250149.1 DUF882 domain-containing protein [Paracoccaceae bacterium]